MSENISQRYNGMASYDLQRYYDLLLVMREYYQVDESKKLSGSKSTSHEFIALSLIALFFLSLFVWTVLNANWTALTLSLGAALSMLWLLIAKSNKQSKFEDDFIAEAMKAGFTRADATEFLYDVDWDDIQYDQSRVDEILKDLEELKNAKNK